MLGLPKPRRLGDPIDVSLADLVPYDRFYRHLEAELDLGSVRAWERELSAERDRPSFDPVDRASGRTERGDRCPPHRHGQRRIRHWWFDLRHPLCGLL